MVRRNRVKNLPDERIRSLNSCLISYLLFLFVSSDCLCGRGGHATNHPGNVHFRMMVSKYKDYYMGLSRYGKLQVAAEVVKMWRSQSPAGRFLAMTNPNDRENTAWHDIGKRYTAAALGRMR